MVLVRFYYRKFMQSDIFLKILIVCLAIIWTKEILYPKHELYSSSFTETILVNSFLFAVLIAFIGLLLYMENKGGEIEWRKGETKEFQALTTKLLVRGSIIACIVISLF